MPDPVSSAEITATAHVMLLDPGVYCVSNAPGSPPPDPATGLPGARLSPAPGPSAGQVMLSGFGVDGWIGRGDEAVLIRVLGAPAPVLVTMYRASAGLQEAPKLQVIRLSEAAMPPGPTAASVAPAEAPEVLAHFYGLGDAGGRVGEWVGERGSQRWVEGFSIQPPPPVAAADLEYQAVLGRGWMSPWCDGGQFCGSRGMSLPILGLAVRLRGAAASTHRVALTASFVDGTQSGPVGGGEPCQADSLAALEAFELVIEPVAAPGPTSPVPKPRKRR